MHFSTYLQSKITEYMRGTDFPAAPTSLEVALSTSDPLADGSGISEPSGHVRQALSVSARTATIGAGVSCANNAILTFGPTAGLWGTITHIAVYDGSGNLLMYGPINLPRTPASGDSISFNIGAIQMQVDASFGHYFGEVILGWMAGTPAPSAPSNVELGICLGDPLEDASALQEPFLGYVRQIITFNAPGSTPTGTPVVSEGPYIFGPAGNAWGLITHAAVFTVGGDLLIKGPVAVQRDVQETDSFAVPFGAITLLFS